MRSRTQKITFIALMTAIIAVCSQLSIPMPSGMPITLQTFAIALSGFFLGFPFGLISVAVFLALGAAGVPVFASFKGGFHMLAGVTGGFLWGFLIMSALCGIFVDKKKPLLSIPLGLAGLLICHVLGIMQYSLVTGNGFWASAVLVSLPYLIKDVASVIGAYALSSALKKRLKISQEY